ncbi:bacillithiol system protein YtxJ [Flavobacterium sp. PL11]|uniref:bacillithiol system redox-active protein YtxJ n=1 Tax=Flavobacterium sp. PL11 TaxID=3071717 RepID=UPI002E0A820A|nr:bacillithiol system protein YtxJ [Flavobacterium sp. PL11]
MSFFRNIFSSTDSSGAKESKIDWIELTDLGQLNEINAISAIKPVAIFKHSTRCSISRMALKQFENEFNNSDKITLYFLDLIENRAISNEIANQFGVTHQSPQLILIKEGKVIYHVSHSDIDADALGSKV